MKTIITIRNYTEFTNFKIAQHTNFELLCIPSPVFFYSILFFPKTLHTKFWSEEMKCGRHLQDRGEEGKLIPVSLCPFDFLDPGCY